MYTEAIGKSTFQGQCDLGDDLALKANTFSGNPNTAGKNAFNR